MKKIILLSLIFWSFQVQAQQEELDINYNDIKSRIGNPNSRDYYPALLKRYYQFDDELTLEDYSLVYYGFSFQDNYSKSPSLETALGELEKKEQYLELIKECEKILKINPVSLKANDLMAYALYQSGNPEEEWRKYQDRYRMLRKVIVHSGDGISCETAFKVIFVSDEYNILYTYFDVEKIHQQKLVGLCDQFEIDPTKYFRSKNIFFDISRKLLHQEELNK